MICSPWCRPPGLHRRAALALVFAAAPVPGGAPAQPGETFVLQDDNLAGSFVELALAGGNAATVPVRAPRGRPR